MSASPDWMTWTGLDRILETLVHPAETTFPVELEGFIGSSPAFLAAGLFRKSLSSLVIVTPSEESAREAERDLTTLLQEKTIRIFPWWETVPYRAVPRGSRVFGERASFLSKLSRGQKSREQGSARIFIVTQRSLQTPVPPPEYISSLLLVLHAGDSFDPVVLAEKLTRLGYTRVPRVSVAGEFALRGEVLDICTMDAAFRVAFDFDFIGKIKTFDVISQSTLTQTPSVVIHPMKEVLWDENLVEKLETYLKPSEAVSKILDDLLTRGEAEGEELFYPILFGQKNTVLDYIGDDIPVLYFDYDRLVNAQRGLEAEYDGLYQREKELRPLPPPEDILLSFAKIEDRHPKTIRFCNLSKEIRTGRSVFSIDLDPPYSFLGNITFLQETLTDLQNKGYRIIVFAESKNQSLRIAELLNSVSSAVILPSPLTCGFSVPEVRTLFIQENEIFGRRRKTPKSLHRVKSAVIDTFVELNPGDHVVHVNYGIGQFQGIERIKARGHERDYIKLLYADEETVFIPIEQVNLVQRYIGNEGDAPALDRIGSKSWENRKNRVKKSVEELAGKLIDLYSRRQISRGFPFQKDGEWQTAFEAEFPWQETDDQLTVTAEVKADMEKPVPMDRLICGDVGYGKTEIALRAAFKAVMNGKQVAFLAPTTLLAEQHYETAIDRFSHFPVRIAHMSRMVPRKEQRGTLVNLHRGEVDMVVGTHRILQKDLHFKDLGLLIVDEEQRFGVKDKERLKELKANIDCLAMSATPIPRTLHMSMLKIRDMSLLTTPPENRRPIETVVDAYNEGNVIRAIRAEIERGGQVFYLHNRVETLDETRLTLERLMPEILVGTAHGKMTMEELDDTFRRFKMGGFHVLVATTIIENGIDIPNVNTIIISRADMFGVSQLYQLRGRVGRSDRKAYAYLFYPEQRSLSEIAMKRLQVISDFTELGSGFKIAMKDMEIRGAGNLLGRDQSGDVYSVGFELYLKLLEDAVSRLNDAHYQGATEALLELEYTGFIPDGYITSPQIKMEIYKKIASLSEEQDITLMQAELLDRFGPVPSELGSLLALADMRRLCKNLSILSLKEHNGVARVEFGELAKINVDKVLKLIAGSNGKVRLDSKHPEHMLINTGNVGLEEKSVYLRELLGNLQ